MTMNEYSCIKRYTDFPFAHRQPNHDGHCSLIHGHNWAFEFTFVCAELDDNGFVIDFGKLKWIKEILDDHFDHTLVLNSDDPMRSVLKETLCVNAPDKVMAKIIFVENCGAEGLAKEVFDRINYALWNTLEGTRDVRVRSVEVFEDSKNSAKYTGEFKP